MNNCDFEGVDFMLNTNFKFFSMRELEVLSQIVYAKKISSFLISLNIEYPGFNKWYWSLFKDNVLTNDRDIIFYVYNNDIAGVAILKHSNFEKKICTLRVSTRFQRMGIGSALIEKSFEIFNNDKPLITIHISKYNSFKSIFEKYNFSLEQQIQGYYGWFKSELSYNGVLSESVVDTGSVIDVVAFCIEQKMFGYSLGSKIYSIPNFNSAIVV